MKKVTLKGEKVECKRFFLNICGDCKDDCVRHDEKVKRRHSF
jgi:hypothetical protein